MSQSLESSDLQLVILALAELSLRRPGWESALRRLSRILGEDHAENMVDGFRETSRDIIEPDMYREHEVVKAARACAESYTAKVGVWPRFDTLQRSLADLDADMSEVAFTTALTQGMNFQEMLTLFLAAIVVAVPIALVWGW